jgi:2-dehydropantoate 2-reductase
MGTRIGIIGVGAIGSVVGGLLTKAGHDVTLIDQWPDHVEAMKKVGLRLSGTCGEHLIPVRALQLCELQSVAEPFDAVFIAVKSYDTEWAVALGLQYLRKPDGVIVDFQNGINDERVAAAAGRERCLGCVITIGAGMYEPGHAIRTDRSQIGFKIGEHDGKLTERAERIAKIMCDVAPTKATTNLWGERWSKLSVNCMANGLAGLSGLGSAEVRTRTAFAAWPSTWHPRRSRSAARGATRWNRSGASTPSASSTAPRGGSLPTSSATWRSGPRSSRADGRRCSRTSCAVAVPRSST